MQAVRRDRHRLREGLFALLSAVVLQADVQWKAPSALAVGEMAVIELRETDPSRPPLMRPPLDERVGSLRIRGVEPGADGRGWRVQVVPLGPGTTVIPTLDLGDGRKSPELRLTAPRTVPFGGPWMGLGGGPEDELPPIPFPWAWASLGLLPLALLGFGLLRRWRKGSNARARKRARKAFARYWPPRSNERPVLDHSHAAGRELLASHLGEESRSWGTAEFRSRNLEPWDAWVLSLDAARFSRAEPPFPPVEALLGPLRQRREGP
jgi:hypothetical protein